MPIITLYYYNYFFYKTAYKYNYDKYINKLHLSVNYLLFILIIIKAYD